MELWIRSQNKGTLIKVERLGHIDGRIDAHFSSGNCKLGTYKSSKRALEVLDEIQNILKPKYILDSSSIRPDGDNWVENGIIMQKYNANARIEEIPIYVYEMPED